MVTVEMRYGNSLFLYEDALGDYFIVKRRALDILRLFGVQCIAGDMKELSSKAQLPIFNAVLPSYYVEERSLYISGELAFTKPEGFTRAYLLYYLWFKDCYALVLRVHQHAWFECVLVLVDRQTKQFRGSYSKSKDTVCVPTRDIAELLMAGGDIIEGF